MDCQDYSFVIDGQLACCGTPVAVLPEKYKRESEPEQHRKTPPLKERQRQLEQQDYRCFYCERAFDSHAIRKSKLIRLHVVWDHMIPFAYGQDNSNRNFVAACQICNSIKSDYCFQTVDEAKIHIMNKWKEKGIE
jgi:5-methylcytosine-specific restriction endonuclease McrA